MRLSWFLWGLPLAAGALSVYLAQWRTGSIPLKLTVTGTVLVLIHLGRFAAPAAGLVPSQFLVGMTVALAASMLGDLFLSRGDSHFLAGLAGFLLAHGGYLTAFLALGGLNLPVTVVAGGVLSMFLLFVLIPRLGTPLLCTAVSAYVAVSVLVLSAAFGTTGGFTAVRTLFGAGALLILFSDLVIAWNLFVRSIRYDELLILSSYYIAQILIGLGCWIVFSG